MVGTRNDAADGTLGRKARDARTLLRAVRRCGTVAALAVVAACGGMTFVVQEYDGPPRPTAGIAIIRVEAENGPDVVAVDDQPLRVALERPNRIHVEVLPGPHEVDIEVTEPEIGLRHTLPVRFVAAAGKVYRVEVTAAASGAPSSGAETRWEAHVYEVDRESDARLGLAAPVTPPPAPTAAEAPPASAAPPAPAAPMSPAASPSSTPPKPASDTSTAPASFEDSRGDAAPR
jgi:hypothetical protein